jgi:CheY-specific phosphatase CheX
MSSISIFLNEVIKFTQGYLKNEFHLNSSITSDNTKSEKIISCINIVSDHRIFLVFSFDKDLYRHLYDISTDGLELDDSEIEEFEEETVSNFINIVAGRVMPRLKSEKKPILSIPLVLRNRKEEVLNKDYVTFNKSLNTEKGNLDILIYSSEVNFVPKDIFAFSMKAKPE